jgi:hypothetical protein
MTIRRKTEPSPVPMLEGIWETYGTWITGGVALVLVVVLAGMLVRRHRESRFLTGVAELEKISQDDPMAAMQLNRLELDYGDTTLGPRIQLKLAQVLYRGGDYDGAEKLFKQVAENKTAMRLDQLQAGLGLAYVAQEKGDLAEARTRYEQVEKDGLYAFEARRMLKLLDKIQKKPASAGDKKGANP